MYLMFSKKKCESCSKNQIDAKELTCDERCMVISTRHLNNFIITYPKLISSIVCKATLAKGEDSTSSCKHISAIKTASIN